MQNSDKLLSLPFLPDTKKWFNKLMEVIMHALESGHNAWAMGDVYAGY